MRLSAMHVCDELFVRSKRFRSLLIDNKFPIFVEQVVAPGKSLPAPKEAATKLRAMALHSIQQWTQRFGDHNVELTIAYTCAFALTSGIQSLPVSVCLFGLHSLHFRPAQSVSKQLRTRMQIFEGRWHDQRHGLRK